MLEKLRAKPHHIKQRVALLATIIIFSGILFVWFSSRDARSQEIQVRGKTVTPIDSVAAMFGGFLSGLKERMSTTEFSSPTKATTPIATSTDNFDLSSVVVIDAMASSTKPIAATTTKKK